MRLFIGPCNNKEKPEECPPEWWKDYQHWLPKEWIGIVAKDNHNKMEIFPFYPIEGEIFGGWKIKEKENAILEILRIYGKCTTSEISSYLKRNRRTLQNELKKLIEKGIIKVQRQNLNDPKAFYYIEEKTND